MHHLFSDMVLLPLLLLLLFLLLLCFFLFFLLLLFLVALIFKFRKSWPTYKYSCRVKFSGATTRLILFRVNRINSGDVYINNSN